MSVFVGEQIQASTGTWTGAPTSFAYQWQDSLDGAALQGNITGATRSDYITVGGDEGHWVRVAVTPSNVAGTGTVSYSDWYGPIGVFSGAPTNTVAPAVTGTAVVGNILTTTNGTWTNTPTSYAIQWQSSPTLSGTYTSIPSQTSSTYTISVAAGYYVRSRLVATNAEGDSLAAYSNKVGPVEGIPDVPTGSRRPDRRSKGGTRPSGRIRRTVS